MAANGRLFLTSKEGAKMVRNPAFTKRFAVACSGGLHTRQFQGKAQRLANVLLLHHKAVLGKEKRCRENIFQVIQVVVAKLLRERSNCTTGENLEGGGLHAAMTLFQAVYDLRSYFTTAQQQALAKWKEELGQVCDMGSSSSAELPSPHQTFKVEALRPAAFATTFAKGTHQCPKCNAKRALYCWNCYEPSVPIASVGESPHRGVKKTNKNKQAKRESIVGEERRQPEGHALVLPLRIDIVIHPSLRPSRCTSIHAAVLCPREQVRVFTAFPNGIPRYDPTTTVVLFPSKDATYLKDVVWPASDPDDEQNQPWRRIERAVFIESTWEGADLVLNHEHIRQLPRVKLGPGKETFFWRFQPLGNHCLSTIEAIYYLCCEFEQLKRELVPSLDSAQEEAGSAAAAGEEVDDHKYDDLLYYFCIGHQRVATFYAQRPQLLPPVSWNRQNTAPAALGPTPVNASTHCGAFVQDLQNVQVPSHPEGLGEAPQ
ncbi:tRNA-uridine aminocarboxypropyltransferase [Balamuthia mandrillaris]